MKKIRFIHCADFHLGGAVSAGSAELNEKLHSELIKVFLRTCEKANELCAEFVLIAGDLFDRVSASRGLISEVCSGFAAHPDIKFVICAGNHDYLCEGGVYKTVTFPDNVYIFKNGGVDVFEFENADIYGYSFTSSSLEHCPAAGCAPGNSDKINLLCAHGETAPISPYCPISQKDISAFDYAALGHIHTGDGIKKLAQSYYGYCGTPLGRDFGECGQHGVYFVQLEKENGLCRADIEKIILSPIRFESEELDISGMNEAGAISEKLSSFISEKGYDENTILRVKLVGNVPSNADINLSLIKENVSGLMSFSLTDGTLPMFDAEKLKADPTVRGAFFKALLPALENGSAEERDTAARALKYGLAALSGENIPDGTNR